MAYLHRQLLYTDKLKFDDFGFTEEVQDRLYELYITTKEEPIGNHCSVVDVFNEVFYALTDIYNDESAAEHVGEFLQRDMRILSGQEPEIDGVSGYPIRQAEYDDSLYNAKRYIYSFVWLILEINTYKPKHVKFFLIALDKQIRNNNPHFDVFSHYKNKFTWNVRMDFPPYPENLIYGTNDEWRIETNNFNQNRISEIAHSFKNKEARIRNVNTMRKVFEEIKDTPIPGGLPWDLIGNNIYEESFWNKLLQDCENEDIQKKEEAQIIEKSKDKRIAELEAQVKSLEQEKKDANWEKKEAERERDKYRKRLEELTSRLNKKYIPASLKTEEAELILNELMRKDIISPLGHNNSVEFVIQCYRWDETGALFGYFVDKMNFQLELADSGGRLNWKIFKMAFANYEEKEKRARDTVSFYKMHQEAKMPENAEKIDDAIAFAEKIINEKKNQPQPPKIKLG